MNANQGSLESCLLLGVNNRIQYIVLSTITDNPILQPLGVAVTSLLYILSVTSVESVSFRAWKPFTLMSKGTLKRY